LIKPTTIWSGSRDESDDAKLEEDDPSEDDGLREPSLGSVGDVHFDQRAWAAGDRRDLELDDSESSIPDWDGLTMQVRSGSGNMSGWCDENRTVAPTARRDARKPVT
jgi:hypothetical protein